MCGAVKKHTATAGTQSLSGRGTPRSVAGRSPPSPKSGRRPGGLSRGTSLPSGPCGASGPRAVRRPGAARCRDSPCHVVVLQPPDLGLLVAVLGLQRLRACFVLRHGVVQGRLGVSGVGLGAVLVDLVLGVVVRDDDGCGQELRLSQTRVVGSVHHALPGPLF